MNQQVISIINIINKIKPNCTLKLKEEIKFQKFIVDGAGVGTNGQTLVPKTGPYVSSYINHAGSARVF